MQEGIKRAELKVRRSELELKVRRYRNKQKIKEIIAELHIKQPISILLDGRYVTEEQEVQAGQKLLFYFEEAEVQEIDDIEEAEANFEGAGDLGDELYKIERFYRDETHPDHQKVIRTNLTLQEAQAWCSREDTHEKDINGNVIWFDGYTVQ